MHNAFISAVPRKVKSYAGTPVRAGFTLVELLVVIGIIAVLISILLPTLSSVQRQAKSTQCLSSLRQFGSFFQLYSNENNGYWPMARHQYAADPTLPDTPANRGLAAPAGREKRWHDFVGKFANNGRLVNWDGSAGAGDTLAASPANDLSKPNAYGSVQDTVSSLRTRGVRNVLRGCPMWEDGTQTSYLVGSTNGAYSIATSASSASQGLFLGYSMNAYTFAPLAVTLANARPGGYAGWTYRTSSTAFSGGGWYFKQNQYSRPAERALLLDSMHPNTSVTTDVPWWTSFNWTKMPPVPDALSFTIDFNRHGKKKIGNGYTDPSLNMLFCDGSARVVSCKEAQRAIRFVTN